MKRLTFLFLVAFSFAFATQSFAGNKRSYTLDPGTKTYVDTLEWSNGVGLTAGTSQIDTIIGASGKDTTSITVQIANLEEMAAFYSTTNSQGTAGGTHTFQCSLQVSLDNTNWTTVSPVFTTSSSADNSGYAVLFKEGMLDTSVVGGQNLDKISAARYARFFTRQASGAADTTFFKLVLGWKHKQLE